jgi:hypothetical protein
MLSREDNPICTHPQHTRPPKGRLQVGMSPFCGSLRYPIVGVEGYKAERLLIGVSTVLLCTSFVLPSTFCLIAHSHVHKTDSPPRMTPRASYTQCICTRSTSFFLSRRGYHVGLILMSDCAYPTRFSYFILFITFVSTLILKYVLCWYSKQQPHPLQSHHHRNSPDCA